MNDTDADPSVARAIGDALQLVDLVRNYGADAIHALIDRWDEPTRRAVLVALAAAVDPDRTFRQLWGWLGPLPTPATTVPIGDVWGELQLPAKRRQVDERRQMVSQLNAAGYSAHEIAVRLGTTPRTVERDRAALDRMQEVS